MALKEVWSGAQTGADRAGLDVARNLGLLWGGWAPRGWRSEDGTILELYREHMKESARSHYDDRTRLNIRDTNGTVVLTFGKLSGGSLLTWTIAHELEKPKLYLDLLKRTDEQNAQDIRTFITFYDIVRLNVAGNRESKSPGIHQRASLVLTQALR